MLNPIAGSMNIRQDHEDTQNKSFFLFPFHIYLMYASVKNYNIQKYEKAGDDEGDLLPFLNNPFSTHSVLPFEDWVVV